ncbi:IclR family transcriptional regulator [Serpentinimonas maccroryi]|uniref:IclR family transcriptional regulator n=1 Tax=Serpentinimonas maccroryi TaxID=1458426 RepID=UPI0020343E26|nr:IclR family transcriptional regulator [Serpentinimonas maccroryi]
MRAAKAAGPARKTDYTNAAQQRLLQVVLALFGDTVQGMAPIVLARGVGCSAAVITRDLDNLRSAGLAERDEITGLWRLTPRLPQQAVKVFSSIERAQRQVDEARNRFTRNPN